jgi:hypothetical protein
VTDQAGSFSKAANRQSRLSVAQAAVQTSGLFRIAGWQVGEFVEKRGYDLPGVARDRTADAHHS